MLSKRTGFGFGLGLGMGFNATGWAPEATASIYLTFVRPVLEYGLDLQLPTKNLLDKYQKIQNLAIRTFLSAPPHTSIPALHRMTGIQQFADRAAELNFLGTWRFHNSTDASIPGVHVWRRAVAPNRSQHPHTIPRNALRLNPLAVEFRPSFLDHSANPLTYHSPPGIRPSP